MPHKKRPPNAAPEIYSQSLRHYFRALPNYTLKCIVRKKEDELTRLTPVVLKGSPSAREDTLGRLVGTLKVSFDHVPLQGCAGLDVAGSKFSKYVLVVSRV
jgi:hypothetical protein